MNITITNLNPCIDWQWATPSFTYGGLNRAKSGKKYVAGKGINVSAALKNLGLDPLCIGYNYRENGDFISQAMDNWGIRHDFVTVDGAVRTNIKLYDNATGEMTEINQSGTFVPADAQNILMGELEKLATETTSHSSQNCHANASLSKLNVSKPLHLLVLSGSMPDGVPPDTYKRMCDIWPGPVLLDTGGEALRLALAGEKPPFCIKPNLYELTSGFGVELPTKESIVVFCKGLIQKYGVSMICVSMGADGALLVTEGEFYYAPALNVDVCAVQGAGDAMVAGLVYGLAQGLTVPELLRTAMAAAAATVARDGTLMCTLEGFNAYMPQVTLA